MADIFRTYTMTWRDSSPAGSVGSYTTENFPPGLKVCVNTALSVAQADSENVAFRAFAFIWSWKVYGAGGVIHPVPSPNDPFLNSVFIDNCASITFGMLVAGGLGHAQITAFAR
jgi:hypothetical protein